MRAISLLQPWASLVALGEKQWETRSWSTNYRGQIAIHASSKKCPERFLHTDPFERVLRNHAIHSADLLPTGYVVAVGYLVACISTCAVRGLSTNEIAFGDFGPGRYAWKIERVTDLEIGIPVKGKLGLWNWHVSLCEFCELPLDARMCPSCQDGPTGP